METSFPPPCSCSTSTAAAPLLLLLLPAPAPALRAPPRPRLLSLALSGGPAAPLPGSRGGGWREGCGLPPARPARPPP